MARTTLADVRALVASQPIDYDDVDLNRYLVTATTYVDDQLADTGLESALLTEIEKYLTAHFAVLANVEAGISTQREDDASVTYTVGQVTNTEFLQSTHFGQVAVTLDTSGTLANAGRKSPQLIAL